MTGIDLDSSPILSHCNPFSQNENQAFAFVFICHSPQRCSLVSTFETPTATSNLQGLYVLFSHKVSPLLSV